MMKYDCVNCKQTLLAKDFYPASIKYGYFSCRICTDEKRKSHKENRDPKYVVQPKQFRGVVTQKIKNPSYDYSMMPTDLDSIEMGQVYIIGIEAKDDEDAFDEPVKIGYTASSVKSRLSQLNSSHWKNLEVIYQTPIIPFPRMLENYFHKKYKQQRIGKEWFQLSWSDYYDIIEECEELPCLKYDISKEFLFLRETNSKKVERLNLLSKLYKKVLEPNNDTTSEDWSNYWNEDDMRYYYENCYNNGVNDEISI